MTKKILIIGSSSEGKNALTLQAMKEKYGDDIVLVTQEEAKQQGLKPDDFANLPKFEITAPTSISGIQPSGKEKRRKRREIERKRNKKSKNKL